MKLSLETSLDRSSDASSTDEDENAAFRSSSPARKISTTSAFFSARSKSHGAPFTEHRTASRPASV